MNKLSTFRRSQILAGLIEGVGINPIARWVGVSSNTVLSLLSAVGNACSIYQDKTFRNLKSTRIECNEIWSFCLARQKKVRPGHDPEFSYGDVYTWAAIDADSRLVPAWYVGRRDAQSAMEFINNLVARLSNHLQLTTDGHKPYLKVAKEAVGPEIDYELLNRLYGVGPAEERFTSAEDHAAEKKGLTDSPSKELVFEPPVQRQGLTMRMNMRGLRRLTNSHSKKIENHVHAVSLHLMHYNFCQINKSLSCSPAMAAGVSDRPWDIEDLVRLLD